MDTENIYKNFNEDKSIEELQYHMLLNKVRLNELKTDFNFYTDLLEASIYKPNIINLFEKLQYFKNNIDIIKKGASNLLIEVQSQINHISKKIECEDVACDAFFITNYELLQRKTLEFLTKVYNDKRQMFEYLRSVIITKKRY